MNASHLTERMQVIKGFDLNLLTIFEAVYIHGSVTKAAKLLTITPSAVSQSLTRLRVHFSDHLFIREGQGFVATTVATNIHNLLGNAYDNLLEKYQELNSNTEQKRLVINCSTYLFSIVLAPLLKIVNTHAPECRIIHTMHDYSNATVDNILTYRQADIVFDICPHRTTARVSQPLYEESFVVICSKNHPRLTNRLTRASAIKEEYALINSDNEQAIAGQLEYDRQINGQKSIRYIAASITSIIAIVESSDAIGIIPTAAYEKSKFGYNIRQLETDFVLPTLPVYMVYNKSSLHSHFFTTLVKEMLAHFSP